MPLSPERDLPLLEESKDQTTNNSVTSDSAASSGQVTRRSFLGRAAASTLLAGLPAASLAQQHKSGDISSRSARSTFLDILRAPDAITAYSEIADPLPLTRSGEEWRGDGVEIETRIGNREASIDVHAPSRPLRYIHLRWNLSVDTTLHVLGDAWERSYGDLGWRNIIPERVLPWYFATTDGSTCHAYGVKTGARSLCFWQLDPEGISLWLNLSNGGSGVKLGQRKLAAATIISRQGTPEEGSTSALRAFCHQLCSQPSRQSQPIYGTNDWYYAYGKNTAKQILDDTDFIAGLSTGNKVKPFSVIDMGWDAGPPAFPSMPELATQIQKRKVRPGIWIRPLLAPAGAQSTLLLPDKRFGIQQESRAQELAYDPTIPEGLEQILAKVKQVVGWGFELVKHDFSTYDLLGRWGSEMGAEPTTPGWSLHDQTRTNAEVILDLYQRIREACHPETLILGCNTVGHLGQGHFDMQRTGDDTSGRVWERTRRMGINTLAFRLPQHETFFIQDADCVGISAAIPWETNRQWLDLLAHSGTTLFISPGEGARVPEHAQIIKEAFQLAASGGDGAEPADPLNESTPQTWKLDRLAAKSSPRDLRYDWCMKTGAYPFTV